MRASPSAFFKINFALVQLDVTKQKGRAAQLSERRARFLVCS
jgi:hypothetical protein